MRKPTQAPATLTNRKVGLVKRTARAEISSFPTGRGPDKNKCSAELIVLVDFKAIYPGVPQGIFAGFPGVAHFLSFTNFLNEQYLVFLCTFLLIFSYSSFHILLIHPFPYYSLLLVLLFLFFSH
jgi:hypothetical protein